MKKLLETTLLVCALAVPSLASALGPQIDISPIRLDLGPQKSTILRLRNQGSEEVRFEVFAFGWSQSERGEMELVPTDDIAFFPSLFSVEPGQTRQIRVGTEEEADGKERAYRLLIKQLPDREVEGDGPAIRVLTDLSVPLFVGQPSYEARPAFEFDGLADGHIHFRLVNRGAKSFQAIGVEMELLGDGGATLQSAELPAWYVLASEARRYDVELSPESCPRASRLLLRARLANGEIHEESIEAPCEEI